MAWEMDQKTVPMRMHQYHEWYGSKLNEIYDIAYQSGDTYMKWISTCEDIII